MRKLPFLVVLLLIAFSGSSLANTTDIKAAPSHLDEWDALVQFEGSPSA